MANGGGGSVVYGIDEDDEGRARELMPLTDRQLPAILEDVVRSGVRPRLQYELEEIDVKGGFVPDVTVHPSSLGPYMVDAYKEQRYFTRHGRSTEPMREREVRDRSRGLCIAPGCHHRAQPRRARSRER